MKFEKAVCPYCGAALKVEPDQRSTKCEYCNSVVLISGHRQEDASGFSNQSDSNAGKENTKPGNIGNNGRELPGEAAYSDLYGARRKKLSGDKTELKGIWKQQSAGEELPLFFRLPASGQKTFRT